MKTDDEYSYVPHSFSKRKFMPWSYCQACGLVSMNNKFTEWATNKGCDNKLHPSYRSTRAKHTELGI